MRVGKASDIVNHFELSQEMCKRMIPVLQSHMLHGSVSHPKLDKYPFFFIFFCPLWFWWRGGGGGGRGEGGEKHWDWTSGSCEDVKY